MKKLLLFSAIIFVVLITACDQQKAKDYGCSEYSLNCELQKDRILLLPLTIDTSKVLFDVFSNKVILASEKNQWYIVGNKVRALVPVGIEICMKRNFNTGLCEDINYNPSPDLLLKTTKNIKIDTVDLSFFVPGLKKVAVVLSGQNEIGIPFINDVRLIEP